MRARRRRARSPAVRSSRNWSRNEPRTEELGADAERDEDEREAEHERDARKHDPAGRAAVTEPIGLDRRDGRQVAGHEWQHAGREERDEAAGKRDEGLGRTPVMSSNRASSSSTRRSSSGSSGSPPPRRPVAAAGSTSTRERRPRPRRRRARPSGSSQARRSNPCFGGSASTPGPNWSTSCALISAALSPAAIRARMYAFIRVAIGELDWSSVVLQVGQTISASRSACTGGAAAAGRPARAGERQRRARRRSEVGSLRLRGARAERPRRTPPCCARCRSLPGCAYRRGGRSGRRRTSRGTRSHPTCRASSPSRRRRPDT